MNRGSIIDNPRRGNSNIPVRRSVIGAYPSTYLPPTTSVVSPATVGTTLRRSFVGATTLPAGFPQGAQVIRVEEPPQVVYHQAPPTSTRVTTVNAPAPVQNVPTRPVVGAAVDVPVVSRPVNQARAPVRKSLVGGRDSACPWWCWLIFGIIALLLILGVLGGLWAYFSRQKSNAGK